MTIDELNTDPTGSETDDQTLAVNQDDVTNLIEILEKAGVTTEEDLQGKMQASSQAGNLANQLGEARNQVRELQSDLEGLKNSQSQPIETNDFLGDLGVPQQPSLTAKDVTDILDERDRKKDEVYNRAKTVAVKQYQAITNDKHYPQVQKIWEDKMSQPMVVEAINSGQLNPMIAYQSIVNDYLSGVTAKALDVIKGMKNTPGTGDDVKLHLESGGPTPSMPGATETQTGDLQKIKDHVNTGGRLSEENELDLISKVLNG